MQQQQQQNDQIDEVQDYEDGEGEAEANDEVNQLEGHQQIDD